MLSLPLAFLLNSRLFVQNDAPIIICFERVLKPIDGID